MPPNLKQALNCLILADSLLHQFLSKKQELAYKVISEVWEMKHRQNKVSQVQAEVENMCAQLPCGASKATYLNELDEFPPLSAANPVAAPTAAAGHGSFALKATELRASGPKSLPRKAQPKSLTGSSTTNTVVSSAITTRQIEVFVSRLHPELVAWLSGRTSVSGRRTFPVLRSTCS